MLLRVDMRIMRGYKVGMIRKATRSGYRRVMRVAGRMATSPSYRRDRVNAISKMPEHVRYDTPAQTAHEPPAKHVQNGGRK